MVFSNLGIPPGAIDIPVINVSTGAIFQYAVMVGGIRTPHTTSIPAGVDLTDGKLIIPAAPATTAVASEVIGVSQEAIPALGTGIVRVFGASFVRTAAATAALNDALGSTTTIGIAGVTTAAAGIFFYVAIAATRTFTFGSSVKTFTTEHAYGFVNALPHCFRLR
jgi:hypothetical protein